MTMSIAWRNVLTALLIFLPHSLLLAASFDDSEILHVEHPEWFVETPFNDLQRVINEAEDAGKLGMMVLFTTDGCSYCDMFLRKALADPKIKKSLQQHFLSVGFEIFNDAEMTAPSGDITQVKHFAKDNGVQFSPTMLFFRADGEPLVRLVGYQSPERFQHVLNFLIEGIYLKSSLRDYLTLVSKQSDSEVRLEEDELFLEPPYALQRSETQSAKPLVVMFAQSGCEACASFHADVLQDEEVRRALSAFDVVRLDLLGSQELITPDGIKLTAQQWFDQFGFTRKPALIFIDKAGQVVLHTDSLVLKQRLMNSINYVLEDAYAKGWTYQRFARQKGMERAQQRQSQ